MYFLTFSFEGKEQGESCEGSILVRSVEESETSAYLIHHHIVNINQLITLLPLLLAILKICLSLALLHITQLLILLLCLFLVFLNVTTQMGGLCRTRVHHGVVEAYCFHSVCKKTSPLHPFSLLLLPQHLGHHPASYSCSFTCLATFTFSALKFNCFIVWPL